MWGIAQLQTAMLKYSKLFGASLAVEKRASGKSTVADDDGLDVSWNSRLPTLLAVTSFIIPFLDCSACRHIPEARLDEAALRQTLSRARRETTFFLLELPPS